MGQQTQTLGLTGATTVAEVILGQLQLWGVKRIYGVVGDAIFGLMDALARQSAISFISVRHESVAAIMASAEAKLTGKLGVCVAHMGPGLTNLVGGLGDAYLDGAPVLAITGQAPTAKIGTPFKQLINQQSLVQAVSSFSKLIVHPDAIIPALAQAMHNSLTQRTVSHLSIPQDLFQMPVKTGRVQPPPLPSVPKPDAGQVKVALDILRSAKQPMILVGGAADIPAAALSQLAAVWGGGIVMSYGAVGPVPYTDPLMLGGLGEGGNPLLAGLFPEADVVLALETSWWPDAKVPVGAQVVQVVSREGARSFSLPLDACIVGRPAEIVHRVTEELKGHQVNQQWVERVSHCKESWSEDNEKEGVREESPMHPANIVRGIEQFASDDAIITLDEGNPTLWFLRNFRPGSQQVVLSSRWRMMGFGLPAAMAAKLCYPHKDVLCVTGDGGLGMVLADLVTAARYNLPITVIVFRNDNLQMERDKMLKKGLKLEGTELTNPDFVKVAVACGWEAHGVNNFKELGERLRPAQYNDRPLLLEINTAQIPHPEFLNL